MNNQVQWISPSICDPQHKVFECEKLDDLTEAFLNAGWGHRELPLIGYWLRGRVQLLSGSHRHTAAIRAGLEYIPVVLREITDVEDAYGNLDKWSVIMKLDGKVPEFGNGPAR